MAFLPASNLQISGSLGPIYINQHDLDTDPMSNSDMQNLNVSGKPRTEIGTFRIIWLLFVLFLIPLVGFVHRLVINMLIDPIAIEFELSDTAASILQGPPFAVVYGLMVIPMGLLADRGNRILLLTCGALIWSCGTLICGLASTFELLFAARVAVGLGEAVLIPCVVSLVGDSFSKHQRGLAMSVFFVGINAGFSSAYAIGGFLLDLATADQFDWIIFISELSPWRQVFVLLAIPGFLLPLLLLSISEPKRHQVANKEGFAGPVRELFASRQLTIILFLLMAQAGILAIADNGIYAWLPRLLTRAHEMGATQTGVTLGVIAAIAGAAGGPFAGAVSDNFAKRIGISGPIVAILGGISIALVATPLFAQQSLLSVYMATALWVTALVGATTATFTFVSVAAPSHLRGVAASLVSCTIALVGLGLGPTTIAVVMDGFGLARNHVGGAILASVMPLCIIALSLVTLLLRATNQFRRNTEQASR